MKTIKALIITFVILSLYSCSKEEAIIGNKTTKVFSAYVEGSNTKTSLGGGVDAENRSILWSVGDSIAVFPSGSTTVSLFKHKSYSATKAASFEGEVAEAEIYYAAYPFKKTTISSSNVITLELPSIQTYKDSTFNEGLFPMVAKSSALSLNFKSLCGLLVLKLTGNDTIKSITFSGFDSNGSSILVAGKGTVDMSYSDVPIIIMNSDAKSEVTLDCSRETNGGVVLNENNSTPFFIVLPPATYSSFKLTIRTISDKVMTKTAANPLAIDRNYRSPTAPLTFSENPEINLSANGTANCYIVSTPGKYSFKATVIGNGPDGLLPDISQELKKFHTTTTNITPLSAQILWDDTESSKLLSNVKLDSGGNVHFVASERKGNALIVVYDNTDPEAEEAKILWSWHIWCTDLQPDEHYINRMDREFTVMDRNLGATETSRDLDHKDIGLFYQWGRKDPFYDENWWETWKVVYTSEEYGTISYAVNNPNAFIAKCESPFDWYYGAKRNNYLWGNPYGYNYGAEVPYSSNGLSDGVVITPKKTIYDPCPAGYMMAVRDVWTSFNAKSNWNYGYTFYNSYYGYGPTSWYPSTSIIDRDGSYSLCDYYGSPRGGYVWSSSSYNDGISGSFLDSESIGFGYGYGSSSYSYSNGRGRVLGCTIRCILGESYSLTITKPTIAVDSASSITSTSATIKGEVTHLGGANVISRGVVYGTSVNPTIETGIKVNSAIGEYSNGKGTFSVNLTNLTVGPTYYYRAFATNSAGTSYSEEKSFATAP